MDDLRQYIISVIAAALICSIILVVSPAGTTGELLRLLCGVFMAFSILQPVLHLDLESLIQLPKMIYSDAEAFRASGEKMAANAVQEIITEEMEAYILKKASPWNAHLNVTVTVNEENQPVSVSIGGEVSPYAKRELEAIIESDLGITKENQIWTG